MANQADIETGFALYREIEKSNELGLSPYIHAIYEDVIEPLLRGVLKDSNDEAVEGKTTQDILKKYYAVRHKTLSPDTLKNILLQLEAVGLIRLEQDKADKRRIVVYPTVASHISSSLQKYMETDRGVGVDSQKIFWQTYYSLENKQNHRTIEPSFKAGLISTGSFTATDAQQAIKEAIDRGELTRLEYDVLCKKE